MAFGQQSGPPATARQIQELVQLLHEAGHVDFRDARGPMGFTQRQAGGRFTRDEADAFIARLHEAGTTADEPVVRERPPRSDPPARSLARVPDEQLAAELRRRGWTVTGP
jgi:hypothetical protein